MRMRQSPSCRNACKCGSCWSVDDAWPRLSLDAKRGVCAWKRRNDLKVQGMRVSGLAAGGFVSTVARAHMELTLSHCEQQLAASEALTEAYSGHAARHVWFNHALASQLGSAAGVWMPRLATATVSHANTMLAPGPFFRRLFRFVVWCSQNETSLCTPSQRKTQCHQQVEHGQGRGGAAVRRVPC